MCGCAWGRGRGHTVRCTPPGGGRRPPLRGIRGHEQRVPYHVLGCPHLFAQLLVRQLGGVRKASGEGRWQRSGGGSRRHSGGRTRGRCRRAVRGRRHGRHGCGGTRRRGGGVCPLRLSRVEQVVHKPNPAGTSAVTGARHAAQLYPRESNGAALQTRWVRHERVLHDDHRTAGLQRGGVAVGGARRTLQRHVVVPATPHRNPHQIIYSKHGGAHGRATHPSSRQLFKRCSSTMNRLPLPGRTGGPTGPTVS